MNEKLALARARAVAGALARGGFRDGRLDAVAYREAQVPLPVPTADQVPEPMNRRVSVQALVDPAFLLANLERITSEVR